MSVASVTNMRYGGGIYAPAPPLLGQIGLHEVVQSFVKSGICLSFSLDKVVSRLRTDKVRLGVTLVQ